MDSPSRDSVPKEFQEFSELPKELRTLIWKQSLEDLNIQARTLELYKPFYEERLRISWSVTFSRRAELKTALPRCVFRGGDPQHPSLKGGLSSSEIPHFLVNHEAREEALHFYNPVRLRDLFHTLPPNTTTCSSVWDPKWLVEDHLPEQPLETTLDTFNLARDTLLVATGDPLGVIEEYPMIKRLCNPKHAGLRSTFY